MLVFALAFAAIGTAACLAVFRWLDTRGALSAVGAATVMLVLFVTLREVKFASDMQRERTKQLATMGRFSQQLAHDLKNPLTALSGSLQFLKKEREKGHSLGDHADFLDLMAEQVQRLRRTVDDYQRIGKIDPICEEVTINDLIRSVVGLQTFASDGISVHTALSLDLQKCTIDSDLIARALENLVRNSVEAMPRGGTITVRTEAVRENLVLLVEDQGLGMDARQRERAFDDFYTTKSTGTGLGLAFVRRVAEAHGGKVSMTSEVGQGTVVRLEIPVRRD
jgi:signal transduction histidine kinase